MKLVSTAIAVALGGASGLANAQQVELPPNPTAGECYARVFIPPTSEVSSQQVVLKAATKRVEIIPARYETVTQTVLAREESTRLQVLPATYETVTEEVMVKPETTRLQVIPATYKTVTEEVLVKPASKRLEVIPASYENVTEQVMIREASTQWKRGRAWLGKARQVKAVAGGRVDDDVMCLVEVPAEYRTVTTRVEKTPASTREIEIPAEYRTVTRQVVDTPASTREVKIPAVYKTITKTVLVDPATTREVKVPAEYKTVKVTKMVEPPKEREIAIPAEYGTVTKTRLVSDGRYEWRTILCETNATPGKIKEIQRALDSAGFSPGPIDGVIRDQTMRAVNAYQGAKGLPVDPYLNVETVKALGVSPI